MAHDMIVCEQELFLIEGSLDWSITNLREGDRPKEEIAKALESTQDYLNNLTPLSEREGAVIEGLYYNLNKLSERVSSEEIVEHIRVTYAKHREREQLRKKLEEEKHFLEPLFGEER